MSKEFTVPDWNAAHLKATQETLMYQIEFFASMLDKPGLSQQNKELLNESISMCLRHFQRPVIEIRSGDFKR